MLKRKRERGHVVFNGRQGCFGSCSHWAYGKFNLSKLCWDVLSQGLTRSGYEIRCFYQDYYAFVPLQFHNLPYKIPADN